jgi:hypothetical protein
MRNASADDWDLDLFERSRVNIETSRAVVSESARLIAEAKRLVLSLSEQRSSN